MCLRNSNLVQLTGIASQAGQICQRIVVCILLASPASSVVHSQENASQTRRVYHYEPKPNDPAFAKFNPRLAPPIGPLMLRPGDRLAIIGDSITEQKIYSRIIETYLTVCVPELDISVRQYGWSGERAEGFLRRMDKDCLRFRPTIATLAYGMNDSRYRPFDINNGNWYRDNYGAVVAKLKQAGARVVVGSPGCAGKIATWVKSRQGTLDEHNLHLCALRDIALQIAEDQEVAFADVFWPMYTQQVLAAQRYGTEGQPYEVAGNDGIHPGGAGHLLMAYAFLRAFGLDGDIGMIEIDLDSNMAMVSKDHILDRYQNGEVTITSSRYPFCADGPVDDHDSIRSGMSLVPFGEDLNRFTLKVKGIKRPQARVTWGEESKLFDRESLEKGIHLPSEFPRNPFSNAFRAVDEAVAAKQAFETHQVKRVFHGKEGRKDFEAAVERTESEREPLAEAIREARRPVTHTIVVVPVAQ